LKREKKRNSLSIERKSLTLKIMAKKTKLTLINYQKKRDHLKILEIRKKMKTHSEKEIKLSYHQRNKNKKNL
jgi:hypothetical protein